MNYKIYGIFILLLLASSIGYSLDSYSTCLNTSTLQTTTSIVSNSDGVVTNTTLTENTFCPYNCSSSLRMCIDDPSKTDYQIPLILGLAIISGFFIALAIGLDDEHDPLRLLFLLFSMFSLYTLGDTLTKITTQSAHTTLAGTVATLAGGIIWLIILMLAYFSIRLFYYGSKGAAKGEEAEETF